mgnify:CR=1 FL=1
MKLAAIHNAQKTTSIDDRIMPLINIVFLLLIFFLVAGVIKDVEPVDVDPPASVAEAESDEADLRPGAPREVVQGLLDTLQRAAEHGGRRRRDVA